MFQRLKLWWKRRQAMNNIRLFCRVFDSITMGMVKKGMTADQRDAFWERFAKDFNYRIKFIQGMVDENR